MIKKLNKFLADENGWEFFITGPAGTGKTTSLKSIVKFLKERNTSFAVTAYTHKACEVIKEKLGEEAYITTLHSFLKVVPMPNENALSKRALQGTVQVKKPLKVDVLIVDEFSMINDKDIARIEEIQDPEYEGTCKMKVIYIGDLNQLPPVEGESAVSPKEPYWIKLTKIWRQAGDNSLLDTLTELNKMIQKEEEPYYLPSNKNFIRKADITQGEVILCYTNKAVQKYNFEFKGEEPIMMEEHFCSSNNHYLTYLGEEDNVDYIDTRGGKVWLDSKYNTLEYLVEKLVPQCDINFGMWMDEEDEDEKIYAYIFGHYNYKKVRDILSNNVVEIQKEIKTKYKVIDVKNFCKMNPFNKLSRKRKKAWRDFLTFSDCVVCIDHTRAMTIHKAQGATFNTVGIDGEDLYLCPDTNLMLKLMYVAVSRARDKVFVNT